jgi:hypothetical protein
VRHSLERDREYELSGSGARSRPTKLSLAWTVERMSISHQQACRSLGMWSEMRMMDTREASGGGQQRLPRFSATQPSNG